MIKSLRKQKLALLSAVVLVLFVLMAIFAPWLAPQQPDKIALRERLTPPSFSGGDERYLLGTDSLGRDVLSRVIYGSRTSLIVGFSAVLVAGFVGILLGLVSGYYQGVPDMVISRIMDVQLAFPSIVLAIAAIAFLGPGLLNLIVVLGVSRWVTYGRVVRGEVLSLRNREFVDAARAIGSSTPRILFRHILPNVLAPILVIASFSVASAIISEASLSFLGLGVPPHVPSWGAMLSDGREYLDDAWWLATFPGLSIVIVVLCINTLGDWLRDYLDPRLNLAQRH